ncbi:Hpt domain-containing protein [Desulfovibrio sp. DV]|uniref:Hpt domain-containing protein n=1 Tax=Desulfovibrio sp. DV TaxID=1844708 RepID=UPI00094BBA65|nr:Hpt domain-containing protein [Desulfovibrio sp. DV]
MKGLFPCGGAAADADEEHRVTGTGWPATFDPEGARLHMGIDPDGFRRIFDCIWHEVAKRRTLLDEAYEAGDLASVILQAHTIKSSAASIGALALSRAAAAVEKAARNNAPDALAAAMVHFHAAKETLSRLVGLG